MASWVSLGTLQPGIEWASFPAEAIGVETFRITHRFTVPSPNPALVCQFFPLPGTGGRATIRKLWAIRGNDPQIITLPIPPEYKAAGLIARSLQLKLGRFPHMETASWTIEIEAFYP